KPESIIRSPFYRHQRGRNGMSSEDLSGNSGIHSLTLYHSASEYDGNQEVTDSGLSYRMTYSG
ncbi:MAG: hypothetical protein ACR2PT_02095, partial [Endozoicomonas sp.]